MFKKYLMFLIFYTTSSFGAERVLVEEFDLPNIKNSQKIYVDKQTAEVRPNGMILVKSVGIWDKNISLQMEEENKRLFHFLIL